MPNWIANTVYVTGDKDTARALRKFMTTPKSKFDFNAVLPMPEEIAKSESSSKAETAWQLKYGDWTEMRYEYGPGQFASREDALGAARAADVWSPTERPQLLTRGEAAAILTGGKPLPVIPPRSFDDLADEVQSNVIKYGFPDWYQWSCATWGTKWPAVDAGWMGPARAAKRDAEQVAYFKTAWSAPFAVITELSRRYPEIVVRLEYHDTHGGACGFVSFQGGALIAEKHSEWDMDAESIVISHHLHENEHTGSAFAPVYVGHERPADKRGPAFSRSTWANPFIYCDCSPEEAAARYRRWLQGEAEVVKQLPPGEWPCPSVDDVRSTFMGKTILCDCREYEANPRGCHAHVLSDLAFNRDRYDEDLAEDECDHQANRGCDMTMTQATGSIEKNGIGEI